MEALFAIRGALSKRVSTTLEVVGILFLISLWQLICSTGIVSSQLLPSPISVLSAFPDLHFKDALVRNLGYSMYLNGIGFAEAIAVCLPIGFLIGLFPVFNKMFSKSIDSTRFLPLTALTGVFIAWFGIEDTMKIQFLALGVIVYLLPTVVQRVREVPEVYQQTAFTLGGSKWQMFTTVFFPHVIRKLVNDIRVLIAISWTYIIVAEMSNNTGGIGALCYISARQGRIDKVFALLFVIILVGFIQDKIFEAIDKALNNGNS